MLSAAEKRKLRQSAHHLKPVVLIGQHGVSDAVLAEIDRALDDHELIKVRMRGAERSARQTALKSISDALDADLVSTIGGVAVLYRPNPDAKPKRSAT